MEQPEGFRVPNLEHHVIRLKKALYGLKKQDSRGGKRLETP